MDHRMAAGEGNEMYRAGQIHAYTTTKPHRCVPVANEELGWVGL